MYQKACRVVSFAVLVDAGWHWGLSHHWLPAIVEVPLAILAVFSASIAAGGWLAEKVEGMTDG